MKGILKKVAAVVLSLGVASSVMFSAAPKAEAESSTGVGLAAWALRANREGWQYVWGATSPPYVDCSGLIVSYHGVGGVRVDLLGSSYEWGYVSNGVPRIHGLGLHQPGHVGVYVGSGVAIDARDEYSGVVYHNVYNRSWVEWFKVLGVSYPQNGWVLLDGDSYYYEDGQYVVDTERTIDGVTYSFNSAGVSDMAPPENAYEATDYSSASASVAPQPEPEPEPEVAEVSEPETEVKKEEPKPQEEKKEESKPAETKKPEAKILAAYGSEDAEGESTVLEMQNRLYELGYLSNVPSGYYGGDTVSAVMHFQNDAKLEVTGKVDEATNNALNDENAKSNFRELMIGDFDNDESSSITALQTRLSALKYYTDEITGLYGETTANSVAQFQRNSKITVTGVADAATQTALFSRDAAVNTDVGSTVFGQSGAAVSTMQKRLIELRYLAGNVSEKFDEETLKAVNLYQKTAGFEQTDSMTAEQLEALYSDDAPKSPDYNTMQFGHKGEDVMKLQTWLAVTKYYDGKQTGTYSLAVREAVKSFQQKHGLGNTGIADEETVKLLQAEAQRESSKAGDQMLLKTAKITDNALASLAENKIVMQSPGEVLVTSGNSRDLVRTIVIFATVLIFAMFLSIIFVIELKRRTRYLAAETDISKYYRRRF